MLPASIYGLVAATIKRAWFTVVMVVLIFMIGISRVVLGMHMPTDVLVGWLFGILLLLLFIRLEEPVKAYFARQTISARIAILFFFSVGFILLAAWVASVGQYQIPAEWEANALASFPGHPIEPFGLAGVIVGMSTLFGLVSGYYWLDAQGGFSAAGVWWKRTLRFFVGVLGVLVFWRGLDMIFPDTSDWIGYSFRYLRYGLTGFWRSGLGPWVFIKLRLAEEPS
jgi:hypothetical protein